MQHVIREQYLHVEVNGTEADGLALQRSLPDLCRNWLTPAIERALERYAPREGHHLYVERLEIDAGTLALNRLEYDLAESVAQAIEKSLQEQVPHRESSPATIPHGVQLKTAQQAINEVFIYFLKTGSLPWSFRLPQGSKLEQVIAGSWQEAAKSGTNAMIDGAILLALASPAARKRLVHQFSPVFLENLLFLLSPEGKKIMEEVLQALPGSGAALVDTKHFECHLWEIVFSNLPWRGPLAVIYLVREAWRILPTSAQHTELAKLLEHIWPGVTNDLSKVQSKFRLTQPAPPVSEVASGASEYPGAEGVYVENAGIVLLHPFLPRLFEALGIAAEDKLLQPERALCLLHFLVTGKSAAPEYELMLPKILCGIPLEAPAESNIELTDTEKEEGDALLEAVIHHWEALRNTSPDGLRGTFLIRAGKVSRREDGDWRLQVETKSHDILMDYLPWGITTIKLPWMPRMLWVEWT